MGRYAQTAYKRLQKDGQQGRPRQDFLWALIRPVGGSP